LAFPRVEGDGLEAGRKMAQRRRQRLGLYPNLRRHREELGWSVPELLSKVDRGPSEKSVHRLENGYPIRLTSVSKLFNTIAKNHNPVLVREEEVKIING